MAPVAPLLAVLHSSKLHPWSYLASLNDPAAEFFPGLISRLVSQLQLHFPNHLGHLQSLHQHLKMVTSTRHTASFLSLLPETTGLSGCWTQLASYSCLFSLLAPGVRMPFPPYLNGLPIGQLCPSKSLLL